MQLVVFSARLDCWHLSPNRIYRSFAAKLLFGWSAPGFSWCRASKIYHIALAVVELDQVLVCPFLQPVWVPLNSSLVLQIDCTLQFAVVSKVAESALPPIIQVMLVPAEIPEWPQYLLPTRRNLHHLVWWQVFGIKRPACLPPALSSFYPSHNSPAGWWGNYI